MSKYRLICKHCNTVHGYSDKPNPDNMPSQCSVCGQTRLSVELAPQKELQDLEFDMFITNKRTAVNKHSGFIIYAQEMLGKTQEELKDIFIEKAAEHFAKLLKSENVNELIGG